MTTIQFLKSFFGSLGYKILRFGFGPTEVDTINVQPIWKILQNYSERDPEVSYYNKPHIYNNHIFEDIFKIHTYVKYIFKYVANQRRIQAFYIYLRLFLT